MAGTPFGTPQDSPWKPPVDVVLLEMRRKGHSFTQIADALTKKFGAAISRNAVKGRLERMKNWALRERAAAALRKMEEG